MVFKHFYPKALRFRERLFRDAIAGHSRTYGIIAKGLSRTCGAIPSSISKLCLASYASGPH